MAYQYNRSKLEFSEDPPVAGLHIAIDLIELLELLALALDQGLQHTFLLLLDLLELLHLEHLRHLELLVVELGNEIVDLLDLRVLRVESVEVVGKLVGAVAEAGHADGGLAGDHAFLVVGVAAAEVRSLFLAGERVVAGAAEGGGPEAVQTLGELALEHTLQVDLDEIGGDVEDVDGVREVAEDVDEGARHLAAHVEVGVLVLQQLDGVLDGAVRGQVLDDLAVDEEEDLHLVLGQVRVLVLVVELDGGVQQRLPDLLRVVLLAHLDRVVQDLLDLYVRREVLLVVVVPAPKDAVDAQRGDAHRLHDRPHALVEVLHAVVHVVALADLQALLDREPAIFLQRLHQAVRLVLRHQLHEPQDRLLRQLQLHLRPLVVVYDPLQVLQLQELVIREGGDQLLLDLGHVVLDQDLGPLWLQAHHVLDLALDAAGQRVLLLPPLLQHQPLEGVLQELEEQHLGGLLGAHVDVDAVGEVALEEADLGLQVGEVEETGLLVEAVELGLDEGGVHVVDEREDLVDVAGGEDLLDLLVGHAGELLLQLGQHLVLEPVVQLRAQREVPDQVHQDAVVLLLREPHRLVDDDARQEQGQPLLDPAPQRLPQEPRDRRQQRLHLPALLPPLDPRLHLAGLQPQVRPRDDLRVLDGEVEGERVEAVGGPQLEEAHQDALGEEVLREDDRHARVLVQRVLLQDPVPLQAQLHVPQGPRCVGGGELRLPAAAVVLGGAPELDEGRDELALVALRADVGETDDEVVLEEALDDDVAVDAGEVEVDGEHVEHVEALFADEVVQDGRQLALGDILDAAVLDELLQHAEEDRLGVERAAFHRQTPHDLVLHHLEEEVELIGLGEELQRDHDHLQVVLLAQQVVQDLGHLTDLTQLLVDVLDRQHLAVLAQLLLLPLHAQVETVRPLVQRDQEDHRALVLLLHLQQVRDQPPVAVHVHSELPLRHEVDLVRGVLVEEGVRVGQVTPLAQHRQLLLSRSPAQRRLRPPPARNQPRLQVLGVVLALHLHLLLPQRFLEDVEVLGVEDEDCVLLSDDEDLALLHLLAEGDAFGELEGVALDPLAARGRLLVLVALHLVERDEEEPVVEGVVEDQLIALDVPRDCLDVRLPPRNPAARRFLHLPEVHPLPEHVRVQLGVVQREDPDRVHRRHREQTAVAELRVALQVEAEERVDLADGSHREVELGDDIVRKLDRQY